jgi:Phosphotransferase enzyme family
MDAVADSVADLTPSWVTFALRRGGLEVAVAHLTAERIGTGQVGRTYLLSLDYEGPSLGAPRRLVAKMAGGDPASRRRVAGGYMKELRFYTELAPTVDVRTPHCWYGALADDGMSFTLLLDEVADAVPGVQVEGCTPEQAADALENVAGLHASTWDNESLRGLEYLQGTTEATASFLAEIVVTATRAFVDRYSGQLDQADAATLSQSAEAIGPWQLARARPFAVVHGDYRLDNLMFPARGSGTSVIDWQTVTMAPPLRDVAYFLGTALETEDRRRHEQGLVALYHRALVGRGVTDYDFASCYEDYRLGQLWAPMVTVLGCIYADTGERNARSDAMFVSMATRSIAAIRDLSTLDLV